MRIAKLGELTKIKTGKLDANASVEGGRYPFFTCSIDPLRIDSYSYDCECVLLAGNGDLNVKYYEGRFDAYQRTYIIESEDRCSLDTRYLYYFLTQYVQQLRDSSIGAVIKYIKKGDLTEAVIPLPEITIQKRIICNLDLVIKLLDKEKKKEKYFDELVKSRFVEMFGYIGEGTFIYPPKRIEDLCLEIIGGGTPSMKHPEYYGGSIPFIKSGDVKSQVVTNGNLSITKEGLKRSSAKLAPMHSILVVTRSGILKHTLPIAIAGCSVAINQDLKALVLNESVIPEYIQWSLLVSKQLILSKVRATTADNIETSLLKNFMVPVPPLQLQHEFADFAAQVDKLKFETQQSIEKLQTLYDSLAQEYFAPEGD